LLETQNVVIKRGKPLSGVLGRDSFGLDNGGDDKFFVNIDAAADGVHNLHNKKLPCKIKSEGRGH